MLHATGRVVKANAEPSSGKPVENDIPAHAQPKPPLGLQPVRQCELADMHRAVSEAITAGTGATVLAYYKRFESSWAKVKNLVLLSLWPLIIIAGLSRLFKGAVCSRVCIRAAVSVPCCCR
jgi:hypothetical protein